MECQECHDRPAALHFTKIVNGKKTEFHICEKCAKEKGDFHAGSNSFSIHNLLSGLLDYEYPITESSNPAIQQSPSLKCSKCGMTYSQFAKSGKFGCEKCYDTFQSRLDPIFKRIHGGNTTHNGKIPGRIGNGIHVRRQISDFKQELKHLIEKEEFEKAAEIRDKIRSLDSKGE
jgi:protein arginine kinase activator